VRALNRRVSESGHTTLRARASTDSRVWLGSSENYNGSGGQSTSTSAGVLHKQRSQHVGAGSILDNAACNEANISQEYVEVYLGHCTPIYPVDCNDWTRASASASGWRVARSVKQRRAARRLAVICS
jgi:hypothetical protein